MQFVDLPDDVRIARPDDYDRYAAVVDDWWGRPILSNLPRLFLDHFYASSLVSESPDGDLRGFLVGFVSPSDPEKAYIQFVAVAPSLRGSGLGRRFYELFFAAAAEAGCREVSCVTSPVNAASIAFHQSMGFAVSGPYPDYDGPGNALMKFRRPL